MEAQTPLGRIGQPDGADVAIRMALLRLPADRFDDGSQGDGREGQVLPGIRLGQRQQVLDQPAHPLAFTGDILGGGGPHVLGHGRTMRQQLGVAADGRQRRAELVRRVGDEAALGLERDGQLLIGGLHLLEHAVEALAEQPDLVPPCRPRQASLEVACARNRVGGLDHGFERPQGPARDQPAGHERRQQRRDRRDDEEPEDAFAVG